MLTAALARMQAGARSCAAPRGARRARAGRGAAHRAQRADRAIARERGARGADRRAGRIQGAGGRRRALRRARRAGSVRHAGAGGATHTLLVERVYPEIAGGRFEIDLRFTGREPPGLRRGQTLSLRIELGEATDALLLACGAFLQDTGGRWVFVLDPPGRCARRREVSLGRRNGTSCEVLGGLAGRGAGGDLAVRAVRGGRPARAAAVRGPRGQAAGRGARRARRAAGQRWRRGSAGEREEGA